MSNREMKLDTVCGPAVYPVRDSDIRGSIGVEISDYDCRSEQDTRGARADRGAPIPLAGV